MKSAHLLGVLALTAFAMMVPLAGCGSSGPDLCIDDSQSCVDRRLAAFEEMRDDPDHDWIDQPPSVRDYAAGTRLFVYRATLDDLSCKELAAGLRETASARQILSPETTEGISAERVGQIIALSDDVNAEIKSALRARCRG